VTAQRLAGLSHQELWNLAHGGSPAAALTSQTNLSKAAQVLENVSKTLSAPLNEFGLGWQGRAADAARAGIGQHAQWAETAAGRASTAAGQAGQQYSSATKVITEMPPPKPAPAPGSPNWAQAEEAAANAKQRALELMQGHAAECARTRPTGTFTRPPTAGTAGVPGTAQASRTAGRGNVVRRAPSTNPAAVEAGVPPGRSGSARPVSQAGLEESPRAGGTGAARGLAGTRPAAVEPFRSGPGAPVRGGTEGLAPGGPVESAPGRVGGVRPVPAEGPWLPAPVTGGPGRVAPPPRPLLPRGGAGATPDGPAARGQRGGERDGSFPLAARGGEWNGGPGQYDTGGGGPHGHGQPGADLGMMPPMMGGLGYSDGERARHERLDYLLDEDDMFDENEWVAPPVIGS